MMASSSAIMLRLMKHLKMALFIKTRQSLPVTELSAESRLEILKLVKPAVS
jgi:hypothetical protein